MPLQNRVAPDGSLHAVAARGTLTGNRGAIHDPATRRLLKRRWTTKAWIACELHHPKGTCRDPMGRNGRGGVAGWTELFFLDEVTALAAGYRPCFHCRRCAANAFRDRFAKGNQVERISAPEIDAILHRQRTGVHGGTFAPSDAAALPDGAMLGDADGFLAIRNRQLLRWSFCGYGLAETAATAGLTLVTPRATVAALLAGYRPDWHASAEVATGLSRQA